MKNKHFIPLIIAIILGIVLLSLVSCQHNGYGCHGTGKLITRVPT